MSPKHHTLLHRDANEAELVSFWRGVNCVWIAMGREAGFDGLLICPRTGIHIVEIKNGAKRWRLTPGERERCQEVEAAGGVYSIVTDLQEAAALVGVEMTR